MKYKIYNIILNYLSIVILLCFTFSSVNVSASHILGSELTYKNVVGNRYKFQLKVYRDCNECKFNGIGGGANNSNCNEIPNLQIRESLVNNSLTSQVGQIELSRVSVKDISPTCNLVSSKCSNFGGNSNIGFEEQLFEGYYDFTTLVNQNICKFDVSISISSRNNKINPSFAEQNFFNYTFINLCNGIVNSSVEFNQVPKFLNINNQSNLYSLGVVNPDGDSLSFKLGRALVNRLTSVNYGSGRGFENPFSYYCPNFQSNCIANPYVTPGNPVQGFYFSRETGDIAFTPIVNNQGGVIVVECEEWKKDIYNNYELVGLTRRDVFSEVVDVNNNLPVINNQFKDEIRICEGENKVVQINVFDIPNIGGISDTLNLKLVQEIPGVTISKTPINSPPFYDFYLNISNDNNLVGKQLITFEVSDNHCDIKGSNSKTLVIDFLRNRNFKITHVLKNCDELLVSPQNNINENIFWEISSINGNVLAQSYSRKINFKLLEGGKYIVKAKMESRQGFCEVNTTDTIVVDDILRPSIVLNAPVVVCKGSELMITPSSFVSTNNSFLYLNNQLIEGFPYNLKVNEPINLNFKVIQENGCSDYATQKVLLFPEIKPQNKDLVFCLNDFNHEVLLPEPLLDNFSLMKNYEIIGENSVFEFTKVPNSKWSFKPLILEPLVSHIVYQYSDTNNCKTNDTLKIEVLDTPSIPFNAFEPVCINQLPFELPGYEKGEWSTNTPFCQILEGKKMNLLDNTNSVSLYYEIKGLCTSKKYIELSILDTLEIKFDFPNNIRLCENIDFHVLKALPEGGQWLGEKIIENRFYPSGSDKNKNDVKYVYKNQNGCTSTSIGNILVDRLPSFFIQSSRDSICYGDVLSLIAYSEDTFKGYWYTDGVGRIDDPNKVNSQYYPSKDDVNIGFLNFSYTIQTENACGNISKSLNVFIKDGPNGEISFNSSNNQCEPTLVTMNSTFKNIDQQKWFVNDSLIDDFDYAFPSKIQLKSGDYNIKTIVRDGACYVTAFSNKFTVLPTPSIKFYSNPNEKLSIEMPRLYLKDQSYCKYGHEVKWFIDDSFVSNDREFSVLLDKPAGMFNLKLIATSLKGQCTDSIEKKYYISSIQQLFIPDAFSPDTKGPDDNNVFRVYGPQMKQFEIEIFNRFGEKVFISNNQNEYWDGTYKRQICMPGVYFYKIVTKDSDGIERDYSGTVTLIR